MQTPNNKEIILQEINDVEKTSLRLDTPDGRRSITARVSADIDDYCQQAYDDGFRSHLGASLIGNKCDRYLWFVFNWMKREKFSGRMQRLFNRGHLEENRYIEWLTSIGFTVWPVDPATGKQWHVSACDGHFGGSADGVAEFPTRYGIPGKILVEFKTQCTGAAFNKLMENGIQMEKPIHYAQDSVYGAHLNLDYGLYFVTNKNDDTIYCECIQLNKALGENMIDRAEKIITLPVPKRLSDNPSYYECKYCSMNDICHLAAPVLKNCRSCVYSVPIANAQFLCEKWNATIPADVIPNGCDGWEVKPH